MSAVPRVFVSYSHDTPAHKEHVRRFATFLRARIGLDVHLDQWYEGRRIDWSAWAIDQLNRADFILAIASPHYKLRADGGAPPDEGRGSQFEASIIRNYLTGNLRRETQRVLPVVLPGGVVEDIPTFLNAYSTTRYEIAAFTEDDVADLLAAITGRGRHAMPDIGVWRGGGAPVDVPLVNLPWTHSANVQADSVVIDGVRYDSAVVLRRPAVGFVEVDLGGRYGLLTATVGVVDDPAERFQVGLFRVHLDGRQHSEITVSLGKPGTVDADLTGVLKLRLEVSRHGSGVAELAWGDPTLR
ncbi:MAG TPA: SEFIR domain-containing protein [Pseudonocardiaceae bacterium]|nr:SEFIR domain-containing protein [Pseudonocardiaceae bacterium]